MRFWQKIKKRFAGSERNTDFRMPSDGFSTPQIAALLFHLKGGQINFDVFHEHKYDMLIGKSHPGEIDDALTGTTLAWIFYYLLRSENSPVIGEFLDCTFTVGPHAKILMRELSDQCADDVVEDFRSQFAPVCAGFPPVAAAKILAVMWLTARLTHSELNVPDFAKSLFATPQDSLIRALFNSLLSKVEETMSELPSI